MPSYFSHGTTPKVAGVMRDAEVTKRKACFGFRLGGQGSCQLAPDSLWHKLYILAVKYLRTDVSPQAVLNQMYCASSTAIHSKEPGAIRNMSVS